MTFGPGTWLVFGIILVPVYGMLAAWFLGEPRDRNTGLMGVSYLIALTVGLWVGFGLFTILLGVLFF
jgi:hypothetical protein